MHSDSERTLSKDAERKNSASRFNIAIVYVCRNPFVRVVVLDINIIVRGKVGATRGRL